MIAQVTMRFRSPLLKDIQRTAVHCKSENSNPQLRCETKMRFHKFMTFYLHYKPFEFDHRQLINEFVLNVRVGAKFHLLTQTPEENKNVH